ncbi:MAG: amidase family protein, partial [Culicoidibacterales bacterium]
MLNNSIRELHKSMKNQEVTPSQVVAESYQKIAEHDQVLNTFVTLNEEVAMAQAKALDEKPVQHLLHGIPIGIKDNIITKDLRTTCGSKMLENFNPVYNATVIEKLLAAGAVPVG